MIRSACLVLLASAIPAAAGQPFDGSWSMSASTQSGACSSYSFELGIADGRIQTPAGVLVSGSGQVTASGVVGVNFTAGSDVISASGRAKRTIASGRWTAPTLACSGTWQAQRR